MPYYSASQKKFYVGGRVIDENDAQGLIEAEQLLGTPDTTARPQGDWRPIGRSGFDQILAPIKNPSRGTLFSKGVGRGIDTMQLLGGRALQLVGAEETGAGIVKQQVEDLRRDAPYQRNFTNIKSGGDALDYAAAIIGEQVPNLALGVLTGGLGALGGRALSGVAASGALRGALQKKAAGEALSAAENKLIRYATAGALVGSASGSYPLIAGEIYGEFRDRGAGADDANARLMSLLGAIPGTALEVLPEMFLAGRLIGGRGAARALPADAGFLRKGANVLKRGATGAAAGAAIEGGTEAAQESIILGLTDQDLSDPENITRLIESFAAGAVVGGGIGMFANPSGKDPTDILRRGNPDLQPEAAPQLQLTGPASVPLLEGPGNVLRLPSPDTIYGEAPASTPLLGGPPPVGTQGELGLVGGSGEQIVNAQFDEEPSAPSTEIQDVLPLETGLPPRFFAPEAPEAPGTLAANPVLQAIQQRQQAAQLAAQRQAEFEQAQAALPSAPEVGALDQRLAESQPFIDVVGTEGTLVPEPVYGTTEEQAAEEWRALAGRGRPKAFTNFFPEIQNQWIDALNMVQSGELNRDDLKTIRAELVQAENVARLTKTSPRTVVTGAVTPTPPKGGKASALKKSKAAKVPPTKQPGTRGETLKQPAARAVAEPTGEVAAKPAVAAKGKTKPVQKEQGKAVQALKEKGTQKKAPPPAAIARGEMKQADRLNDAVTFIEEATTKTDKADVRDAYYDVLEIAFFDIQSGGKPEQIAKREAMVAKGRKFLSGGISKEHQPLLIGAFRAHMRNEGKLSATDPWFQFAVDNDLLDAAAPAKGKVTDIGKIKDADLRARAEELFAAEIQPAQTKGATFESQFVETDTNLYTLSSLLSSLSTSLGMLEAKWDSAFMFQQEMREFGPRALAEDMYAEVNPADLDRLVAGYPLRSYFTKDGALKLAQKGAPIKLGDQEFYMLRLAPEGSGDGRFSRISLKGTKVVDENGAPLKVLHGTYTIFSAWKGRGWKRPALPKFKTKVPIRSAFSDDYIGVAGYIRALKDYRRKVVRNKKSPETGASWFTSDRAVAEGYGSTVREVYLNIQRPVIYDAETNIVTLPNGETKDYSDVFEGERSWRLVNPVMFDLARSEKADGLILKGIVDGATEDTRDRIADVYIALKPEQIVPADINVLNSFNLPDKTEMLGSVKLKTQSFVSKLATKPKVSVYRNQGDLKANNPALYREATAASSSRTVLPTSSISSLFWRTKPSVTSACVVSSRPRSSTLLWKRSIKPARLSAVMWILPWQTATSLVQKQSRNISLTSLVCWTPVLWPVSGTPSRTHSTSWASSSAMRWCATS